MIGKRNLLLMGILLFPQFLSGDNIAERELFVKEQKLDFPDEKNMGFAEDENGFPLVEVLLPDESVKKQEKKTVYMKIITAPQQYTPIVFHLWAWKFKDHFIVKGENKRGPTKYFHAGDETEWIPLHDAVEKNYSAVPGLKAVQGDVSWSCTPVKESYYTVLFSTSPSENGVFERVTRSGRGSGMTFRFMYAGDKFYLTTDFSESAENRKRALAAGEMPGRRPIKFPIATTLGLGEHSQEIIDNELTALSSIGINTLGLGPSSDMIAYALDKYGFTHREAYGFGLYSYYKKDKMECHGRPNLDIMEKVAESLVKSLKESGQHKITKTVCMMDEPGMNRIHITQCEDCIRRFPLFLKERSGLEPKDFGVADFNALKPDWNSEKPELFYWTGRFFNHNMTELYRSATKAVERHAPYLKTCVNIGTEATDNILGHGNDWWEIYSTGALTYGLTEDWANLCGTFQVSGFQSAALRMVCRPFGYKWGMYDICYSGRTRWEIEVKAFTHLGQGIDSLTFFSYGPSYANADAGSWNPDLYKAIKTVSYTIGEQEDVLLASTVARGDAAILYSRTGDIWSMSRKDGNHYGKERTAMFVLLHHLGIRSDLIPEYRLAEELANYKLLFALDRHIERKNLLPVLDWVKHGGTLYLAPGALEKDCYDRTPPEMEALKLPRSNFALSQMNGYYLASVLGNRKPETSISVENEAFPVLFLSEDLSGGKILAVTDSGKTALSVVEYGKGKIIMSSFFTALSYLKTGKHEERSIQCCWSAYSVAGRSLMKLILRESGVEPKVFTNHYLVESHLLEGEKQDILILANWSGKVLKDMVTTLRGEPYVAVKGVRTKPVLKQNGDEIRVEIPELDSGDIIVLEKKRKDS